MVYKAIYIYTYQATWLARPTPLAIPPFACHRKQEDAKAARVHRSSWTPKDPTQGRAQTMNSQSSYPAEVRKWSFFPFFSAKGVVKFGVKFWWNFPCYVFQGLGVRRKISPKFHVKNGVKKTENFTQISLCWSAALRIGSRKGTYHPGRNYHKIIPWNDCFCNIFVVFSSFF